MLLDKFLEQHVEVQTFEETLSTVSGGPMKTLLKSRLMSSRQPSTVISDVLCTSSGSLQEADLEFLEAKVSSSVVL